MNKVFVFGLPILLIGGVSTAERAGHQQPTSSISAPFQGDEFVGPFPSWDNIKTSYGAVGNGTADDTLAIQQALNMLGRPGHSSVLFFPSGTYRITKTLVLMSNVNVSMVGEDPATTTIIWDGEIGGPLLSLNGVAYSRFTRLTLNGKRRASVAVEQSWDNVREYFDTGNEYSDDRFVDVEYGIHGGFKGFGFAETSIRRSHFIRNTKAGVALGNFNALDIWVWDSLFEDCYVGITNNPGAGNFHVYNSVFRHSLLSDLAIGNTGGFSARGNYSVGSRAFFTGSFTSNPATINIQRNTIIDPADSMAIRFRNQGPGLILDNIIRSRPGAAGPVISWASVLDADFTSIGNTFTLPNPLKSNGRLVSLDDRVVSRDEVRPAEPVLPGPLPNLRRQIFEVRADADAGGIQSAIVAAARQNGKRPVVHIPDGTYSISETLTVPASDIQLVGDGYGTILQWTGTGVGPVLRVQGPSKATLREIQIDGAEKANGIVIENVDQAGSRVYMDQAQLRAGRETNLFVDSLDNTTVQLEDLGHAYSPDGVSIKVTGGPLSRAGKVTAGRTNIFSGASSSNKISYEVSGGATVLVRDSWYESILPGFANIHDGALFTIDGARVSSKANSTLPAFALNNVNGFVAILTTDIDDRITIIGNGRDAKVLGLGVIAEQKSSDYFMTTASPPADARLVNSRQLAALPGIRSVGTKDVGQIDPDFIRNMLSHTRSEHPQILRPLSEGVTDVRLFRVWVASGLNNIALVAEP